MDFLPMAGYNFVFLFLCVCFRLFVLGLDGLVVLLWQIQRGIRVCCQVDKIMYLGMKGFGFKLLSPFRFNVMIFLILQS